jgi:hypothetical protein
MALEGRSGYGAHLKERKGPGTPINYGPNMSAEKIHDTVTGGTPPSNSTGGQRSGAVANARSGIPQNVAGGPGTENLKYTPKEGCAGSMSGAEKVGK